MQAIAAPQACTGRQLHCAYPPLLPTATPELVHLDLEQNRIRSLPTSSMQWTMLEVLLLEGNSVEVIFAEDEDGPTRWPRLRSFTGLFVTVTVI